MNSLQLEVILKNFSEAPNKKMCATLDLTLRSLSLTTLNDFCLQNETIRTLLGHPDFQYFWQEKMAGIKVKGLPDFKFKTTASLTPMEITLGYFNYLQSLRYPDEATKFIHQALSFHSFHALEAFSQELIINIDLNNEKICSLMRSTISFFEQEAAWHGTPAYLLVAKLYFRWALALTDIKNELVPMAYQMTLKNIELAKILEIESANDLNNVYFGLSLAKNNPFYLSSIEDIRAACIQQAGDYLEITDITKATHSTHLQKIFRMKTKMPNLAALPELHQAILNDLVHTLRAVFKQNELESKNSWGETALLFAIRHNKIDSIRCLLSLGADCTQTDSQGVSALRLALETEQLGIARLLLNEAPQLIEQQDIFLIAKKGPSKTLDALKKIPTENELKTLEQAFLKNNNQTIQKLLEKGLSPNIILSSGKTGLAQLFLTGNNEGIELLLKYGTSLSLQDAQGETIIFSLMNILSSKTKNSTIKYYFHSFITLGADINVQNNMGETLLIQAVKRDDIEAVSFLLQQDHVDLKKQTKEGLSALDYAKKLQYHSLISLLSIQKEKNVQQKQPDIYSAAYNIKTFWGLRTNSSPRNKDASCAIKTILIK